MTATNHALTGAIIGLVVGEPLIALPAALGSHFVCDALPHFGGTLSAEATVKSKNFRNYLIAEACICVLLVICLFIFKPQYWFLASVCAFLATSPDLVWINKFLTLRRGQHWKRNAFEKFADEIQWFAKPIGAAVEVAWFAAAIIILTPFLH